MPVSPFGTQPSPNAIQGAAMQGMADRGMRGGAPTADVQNPVAQHVVAIIDLIMSHSGDPAMLQEDLSALQQLGAFIQQLVGGGQATAPQGQAGPPGGMPPAQGPPLG